MITDEQGVKDTSESPSDEKDVNVSPDNSGSENNSQSQSSGVNTTPKTYTEEEVNEILHKRTKDYSEKIKSYEEQLSHYNSKKEETNVNKGQDTNNLSEEDKVFVNYFKQKILPQIQNDILPQDKMAFIEALHKSEEAKVNTFLNNGENTLKELMAKNNIPEENITTIKEVVASMITNDKDLANKFLLRDPSVFNDAYNKLLKSFDNTIKSNVKQEVNKIVKSKEASSNVKQPVKNGLPGALTEKKKLSDAELVDAAFKSLTSNNK